ncbi:selenocysteine-specific translation elongation factor, partial [Pseudoflavonifractor phocaeensis]|uniref:selenocysteine-specific translation elongation factor n=1 Tax=Pseudoflavonifractor phocaeensis TaxID=1870988 RepID=UPI001957CB28
MKHVVLAAAGHVDHGKTALVRALTGVDTDTLPEEKRRGLSIETGFAPLDLADGVQISLADVPGHARLIPHMLAGVCGADGFLLVIAADEGVMPQTAEHLDLLTILGIKRGIIALTKTDRVDGETLDRRREEIARWAAARGLSGMPICPVSAVTGRGLDGLRAALAALAEAVQPRETGLPFRLWVDRVFSIPGQGTVVTGTAAQGRAAVGETLCFYPGGTPARVRSIQRHGQPCETLWAGMRGGLNLA